MCAFFGSVIMNVKIIILMICGTTFSSGTVHELNVSMETNRTSRDIKVSQDTNKESFSEYQPPIFNYQTARQMAIRYQDQRKQRYVQQQQMDMKHGLSMRILNLPTISQHKQEDNTEEWKPFQSPTMLKRIVVGQRKAKNVKLQKYSKADANDLNEAGSEKLEHKELIDRHDIPESARVAGNLVYLEPSLVQQILGSSKDIEVVSDSDGQQISKIDYSALSDLIGKNPNVQLEGLQRLLKENTPKFSVIQEPQPFQVKDHTPITEKSPDVPNPNTKPNIKVDHEQTSSRVSSLIPSTPIGHNDLENIQKQLDEASKFEANEAFILAQESARAHVEAQHKAIEKAQKDIFENLKNSLDTPQALALVQTEPQKQFIFGPTPVPENLSTTKDEPSFKIEIPEEKAPISHHLFRPNLQEKVVFNPYYAPNHSQVKSQNEASFNIPYPLEKNKSNQKLPGGEEELSQTYQQFQLEIEPAKLEESISGSAKQQDGSKNVQYAANYAFGYRIKDVKEGNDFGHQEKRQGKKAQGRYYVLLPDGRKQHVEYYADDSGYHAKISYDKVAHHR